MENKNLNFKEYYKYYLTLHQNRTNKILHILGQITTVFYFFRLFSLIKISLWFIPLFLTVPFIVYPFTFLGHYCFEKNVPASKSRIIFAKAGDWMMMWDILRGKIKI